MTLWPTLLRPRVVAPGGRSGCSTSATVGSRRHFTRGRGCPSHAGETKTASRATSRRVSRIGGTSRSTSRARLRLVPLALRPGSSGSREVPTSCPWSKVTGRSGWARRAGPLRPCPARGNRPRDIRSLGAPDDQLGPPKPPGWSASPSSTCCGLARHRELPGETERLAAGAAPRAGRSWSLTVYQGRWLVTVSTGRVRGTAPPSGGGVGYDLTLTTEKSLGRARCSSATRRPVPRCWVDPGRATTGRSAGSKITPRSAGSTASPVTGEGGWWRPSGTHLPARPVPAPSQRDRQTPVRLSGSGTNRALDARALYRRSGCLRARPPRCATSSPTTSA